VVHRVRRALVARPNLLGAMVIKAAAVNADPRPQRHLFDLAFLCSLVGDPIALRTELTAKDRSRLHAVAALAISATKRGVSSTTPIEGMRCGHS
jgi:hypothetical protein